MDVIHGGNLDIILHTNLFSKSLWPLQYINYDLKYYMSRDSYPVQYLGYCTVCNSTNLNRWKYPMAPAKCQLINPREREKKP